LPTFTPRELQGIDASWLAVDAIGQVALFTTGGQGPVPNSALESVEFAEELVHSIPETSNCDLFTTCIRPDDFIAFAKRGLFACDWSDVHRTNQELIGGHELLASPLLPIKASSLPPSLNAMTKATILSGVTFGLPIVALSEFGS
jgi:hypothetical protein